MKLILNTIMLAAIVALIFTAGYNFGKPKHYMEGYNQQQIDDLPEIGVDNSKKPKKERIYG